MESIYNKEELGKKHQEIENYYYFKSEFSNEEIEIEEVLEELKARFGTSGHEEKASRGKSKEEE